MREIEVIRRTRAFLLEQGLTGRRVVDLYTDAHPTLVGDASLRPFQRFTLALEGFTVHPDLVGRLDNGETTFAFEAKGTDDRLRGLAQAACYRFGFHLVFLTSAGVPPADLLTLARQQHVGVLAAYPDQVAVVEAPIAHLPLQRHATAIREQFVLSAALAATYIFNLPTHYLAVARMLRDTGRIPIAALETPLRAAYPELPRGAESIRGAVRGAQKLGLVRVHSQAVALTMTGEAATGLLPDLATIGTIHRSLARRGAGLTLDGLSAQAGAVLRWLLAADPVVELIVATLADLDGGPVPLPVLARKALERDRARALAVFFTPELVAEITDTSGAVDWTRVEPRHFRSTTFYQYKSLLKHAGIIASHPLGGASTRGYDPNADLWALQPSKTGR